MLLVSYSHMTCCPLFSTHVILMLPLSKKPKDKKYTVYHYSKAKWKFLESVSSVYMYFCVTGDDKQS